MWNCLMSKCASFTLVKCITLLQSQTNNLCLVFMGQCNDLFGPCYFSPTVVLKAVFRYMLKYPYSSECNEMKNCFEVALLNYVFRTWLQNLGWSNFIHRVFIKALFTITINDNLIHQTFNYTVYTARMG